MDEGWRLVVDVGHYCHVGRVSSRFGVGRHCEGGGGGSSYGGVGERMKGF